MKVIGFNRSFFQIVTSIIALTEYSFLSALINLLTNHDIMNSPDSSPLPETFRMDTSRLVNYYNEFQDISIMAALILLFKQVCGPKTISPSEMSEIKKTLWILLNNSDTSMEHVTLQLAKEAGKIRNKELALREIDTLRQLIDKTLAFDNPLFLLIQKRVHKILANSLHNAGKLLPDDQLSSNGLVDLKEELQELTRRIKHLADHNRITYAPLYDSILQHSNPVAALQESSCEPQRV
jgi:hypothetical protein